MRWPGQTCICRDPFDSGGRSSSSTSSSTNNTNVQVATTSNVTVPISESLSVNTTDLADAIKALAGAQQQAGELQLLGQLGSGQAQAAATVQAAKINASQVPWPEIITAGVAVIGLLYTMHVFRKL